MHCMKKHYSLKKAHVEMRYEKFTIKQSALYLFTTEF
jgi:hypothetical protein